MENRELSISCKNCNSSFIPSGEQAEFITTSISKKMTFIMLKCPNCYMTFDYNPMNLNDSKNEDLPMRTPISGSHGFVSFIEDNGNTFFGCGETGAIWRQEENLFRDVDLIVEKYPHRKKCYTKTDDGWSANSNEPENMDDLIDKEKIDNIDKFERD